MTEKKTNGQTELVFILDRSGSMSGLESDTIGGFNGMLTQHRSEGGDVLVSTVLFDHENEVIHVGAYGGAAGAVTERRAAK